MEGVFLLQLLCRYQDKAKQAPLFAQLWVFYMAEHLKAFISVIFACYLLFIFPDKYYLCIADWNLVQEDVSISVKNQMSHKKPRN